MVITKENVRFGGFNRRMVALLGALVYMDTNPVPGQPKDLMITSANDSTHLPTSKHYKNLALDLRCKDFDRKVLASFIQSLQTELGNDWTLLHEDAGTPNEHLHVQLKMGLVS